MIQGLAQLESRIKALPAKVGKRIARKALNKAAGAIVRGIRKEVPKGATKSAAKEIGKRITTKGGIVVAKVGVGVSSSKKRHRDRKDVGDWQPHAHLLALGTKDRYTGRKTRKRRDKSVYHVDTGKGRAYRGRVIANRFVSRGTIGARQEFARLLQESIKAGIEKESAK